MVNYVSDYVSEQDVVAKFLQPLFHETLGYPNASLRLAVPVPLTFGRETKTKQADLIVSYKARPVIAVEAKRPTEPLQPGVSQVDSYASALQTPYSIVTNGRHFILRGYYESHSRINVIEESITDLRRNNWGKLQQLISFTNIQASLTEKPNKIEAPDEELIKDYRRFFRRIHNAIRDRDKLDPGAAFDELSKLLFLKAAEDEWRLRKQAKPILTNDKIDEWDQLGKGSELINQWFESATTELFPDVFEEQPRINLSTGTVKEVLELMQPFHVKNGEVDVKGRAFEEFLPTQLRGEGLGQYFTPRPIVNFMAEMAEISIHDVVVDFSCGSGGFLIKAFQHMKGLVEQLPSGTWRRLGLEKEDFLETIKAQQIFGIDAEPRAARTAKMNMLMWGDGKRVVRGNALATTDFNGKPYDPPEYNEADSTSGCTLILANPPFGSNEKDQAILERYDLGSKRKQRKSQKTEILFLEKGLRLLRPEGKMLIVLPQGIVSNRTYSPVRDLLHSEAEIRAIISLPSSAFVQSGVKTVNTCILYVQKFTKEKKSLYDEKIRGLSADEIRSMLRSDPEFDYPIFMGTAEFIGYEPNGRPITKGDEKTDLDLLLEDFRHQDEITKPDTDLFEFAKIHYDEKSSKRSDIVIRGTRRGLKNSFVVPLSETEERLDPPFYLMKYQAGTLLESLQPLKGTLTESKIRFLPKTDDELDAEYPILTVSNDGKVSLKEYRKGEEFNQEYEPYRQVHHNDIVYNPYRIDVGSVAVVPKELSGGYVSPAYVVFRSKRYDPQFLVNLIRTPFYKMYIDLVSTASIRDAFRFELLENLHIPVVTDKQQKAISRKVEKAESKTNKLLKSISSEKGVIIDEIHKLIASAATPKSEEARLESKFVVLARQWREDTEAYSSITHITSHPAYQEIIMMGNKAIPLILRDLEVMQGHWYVALKTIVGMSPVPAEHKGKMQKMREAWLAWGRENGHL